MTNAVSVAQYGSTGTTTGFKNRIINGAMVIDQRNAGVAQNAIASGSYMTDRWSYYASQASKFNAQQNAGSVTPPIGFINYQGMTTASAYSVGAGDYFFISQQIEGYNIADLGWGTANAKTVTVSFWAYSSLTGTFGGAIRNSTNNYSYPFSYSIPVANTWTQISIIIAGPTAGTWNTTNTQGLSLSFSLGTGSTLSGTAGSWSANQYVSSTGATSVVGTSGATFYITGVQLEVGSSATSFDYRPYGTEFNLCQRYYQQSLASGGNPAFQLDAYGTSGTYPSINVPYQVAMRTLPTATVVGTWFFLNCTLYQFSASPNCALLISQASGSGRVVINASTTGTGYSFSAEL
jgi:hypothetical protein